MEIKFDKIYYTLSLQEFSEIPGQAMKQVFHRLLHRPVTSGEMETLAKNLGEILRRHMEYGSQKIGLGKGATKGQKGQ